MFHQDTDISNNSIHYCLLICPAATVNQKPILKINHVVKNGCSYIVSNVLTSYNEYKKVVKKMELNLFPKFIDEAAGPPAQAVGNTLANIWQLGIGSHVSLWVKKQEARQQENLKDYIQKVEEKTQEIPEKFLTEPQLHIVGPAIEASKFYINSEKLREMFANLIASSIDSRKTDKTHPSFVEIIKQLSPLDAGVLSNFKDIQQIPLAEIRVTKKNNEYRTIQEHVMNFTNSQIYKSHATSLSNLQRLGLLNITYSVHSANISGYEYVKDHPAFQQAKQQLLEIQKSAPEFTDVDFQKGICSRTPLCEDFVSICL
jgi:hypothetical protein